MSNPEMDTTTDEKERRRRGYIPPRQDHATKGTRILGHLGVQEAKREYVRFRDKKSTQAEEFFVTDAVFESVTPDDVDESAVVYDESLGVMTYNELLAQTLEAENAAKEIVSEYGFPSDIVREDQLRAELAASFAAADRWNADASRVYTGVHLGDNPDFVPGMHITDRP